MVVEKNNKIIILFYCSFLLLTQKAADINNIKNFTRQEIEFLTNKQIKALWIRDLKPEQIEYLKPKQIKALTQYQIQWLTEKQIKSLTPNQISWLELNQIQHFDNEQISTFYKNNTLEFFPKNSLNSNQIELIKHHILRTSSIALCCNLLSVIHHKNNNLLPLHKSILPYFSKISLIASLSSILILGYQFTKNSDLEKKFIKKIL